MSDRYTAITFAPVQGFIEKSRKLRDLYGSSFILSYLANQVCETARVYFNYESSSFEDPVISPAQIDVTQGTPNQIIIRGEFPRDQAQAALDQAWALLIVSCQRWIKANVPTKPDGESWPNFWDRSWREWSNHTWEFFWATGNSIDQARHNLNQQKNARAWIGINYVGESSTLSGQDSRAWPFLGRRAPHTIAKADEEQQVRNFYKQLSAAVDDKGATITPEEQLSIPELIKRLVTIDEVIDSSAGIEKIRSFKALRRWSDTDETLPDDAERDKRWTGWFQGDGDRAGDYLKRASQLGADPEVVLHTFSREMREWGYRLEQDLPPMRLSTRPSANETTESETARPKLRKDGRIVYAGGDDFLGILYRNPPYDELPSQECLDWFYRFKSDVWGKHRQPITVSVGFVWASPQVPQRDVLQHCRIAEKSAKTNGRDRIALRILFGSGNHLEWHCPWRFLSLLQDYRDRDGGSNWTHIYNDVATLEARHAFNSSHCETALSLFKIYFRQAKTSKDADRQQIYDFLCAPPNPRSHMLWEPDLRSNVLWNIYKGGKTRYDPEGEHVSTGILGDCQRYEKLDNGQPSSASSSSTVPDNLDIDAVHTALTAWIINLAKVGFQLCSNT